MIPERLQSILRCLSCKKERLEVSEQRIVCGDCGSEYPIHGEVPSLLAGGAESQRWNPWDLDRVKMMADSYYKRAKGELPEKEASKSYARLLKERGFYTAGDSVLDVGCATGHFLRSFRRLLDPDITYTGIDINEEYLQWGTEVFGVDDRSCFVHSDALNVPFQDGAFDLVVVNLFHFFPKLDDVLREAMRLAKKMVIWRTPVGVVNYAIKVIYTQEFEELGVFTPEREDMDHSLYMLYSRPYIEGIVRHLGGRVTLFERDADFEPFDNTALEEFQHIPSTKVVNGMQINGNLILDWHYVGIEV